MSKGKPVPNNEAVERINPLLDVLGPTAKIAGSLRRMKATVHDADIVVSEPPDLAALQALPKLRIVEAGDEKIRVQLDGFQADIVVTDPEHHGAAWLYLTGPKDLNLAMRARAKDAGLKLNQRGLWRGDELVAAQTEKEIFAAMGLRFVLAHRRDECTLRTADADWTEAVVGSRGNKYEVSHKAGSFRCTCRGYSFHTYENAEGERRKWCSHIDTVIARLGLDNPMTERKLVQKRRKAKRKAA